MKPTQSGETGSSLSGNYVLGILFVFDDSEMNQAPTMPTGSFQANEDVGT